MNTAEIRARHHDSMIGCTHCGGGEPWPCDAIQLCDALDEATRLRLEWQDFATQQATEIARLNNEINNFHFNDRFTDRMMDAENKVTEQAAEIDRLQRESASHLAGWRRANGPTLNTPSCNCGFGGVHDDSGFIDRITEQAAEIEKLQVLCARLLAGLTP